MFDKDSLVKVLDNPDAWFCMQCHAPNNRCEVGSENEKMPTGSYEGTSCLDYYNPHSNQLKNNYRSVYLKNEALISSKCLLQTNYRLKR